MSGGDDMAITERQLWLMFHLALGALFLHSFATGLAGLGFRKGLRRFRAGAWTMALAAWLSVISGTYLVYPAYRAPVGPGEDIAAHPKAYLVANAALTGWHDFGMEWKEHIGWLVPMLATALAYVAIRYGHELADDPKLRRALLLLFGVACFSALVAGGLGSLLNKVAPNAFLNA
jgi:hypothetical protein